MEKTISNQSKFVPKERGSLLGQLRLNILLLALLPMIIISIVSYKIAYDDLYLSAKDKLQQTSILSVNFIQNWFEFRFKDLEYLAASDSSSELLTSLINDRNTSDVSLTDYIMSDEWLSVVNNRDGQFKTMLQSYNYIYDIFLIDPDGNIIYTVIRENDLGTNLFDATYSSSNFSKATKATLSTGLTHFSDIEHYKASNLLLSGFVTSALKDDSGNNIGVIAIQVKVDRLYEMLDSLNVNSKSSLNRYLVGTDKRLRSEAYANTSILGKTINIPPVSHWISSLGSKKSDSYETIMQYRTINNKEVIGHHQTINIQGTTWLLISEIEYAEALSMATNLGYIVFSLLIITGFIIVLFTYYQVRKIINPLNLIVAYSLQAADLQTHSVKQLTKNLKNIDDDNEIGFLSEVLVNLIESNQRQNILLADSKKKIQKSLYEFYELQQAMDYHSIVVTTNAAGIITSCNQKFCDISGFKEKEILGKTHQIINSGYHDGVFWKDLWQTISSGKVWSGEIKNIAKQGNIYWVHTTIVPFIGQDGKPESYIAIRTDITARKEEQFQLAKSKEKIQQSLYEFSELQQAMDYHSIVVTTNAAGIITSCNQKFCDISGFKEKEILGKTHQIINSGYHDGLFWKDLWQTISSGKVWSGEIKNKAKQGNIYWVHTTIVPFIGDSGRPESYIAIRTDITARKEEQFQLANALSLAKEANESKRFFLANMSHEIRTPMNGIIGMTSLMLDENLDYEQRERALTVARSAESLLSIINDILDFSKIEAGKMGLEIIDFDMLELLEDFAATVNFQAKDNLDFICPANPIEHFCYKGDPGRIRQIIINLVGNAFKFTNKGEISVSIDCEKLDVKSHKLTFSVRDTGIGLTIEQCKTLFTKFTQADNSTTRKFGGTGLGLAISRELVELMGGEISVTSVPNEGSDFHFSIVLPVSKFIEPAIVPVELKKQKIMVMIKNQTRSKLISDLLSNWGIEHKSVTTSEQALRQLSHATELPQPFTVAIFETTLVESNLSTNKTKILDNPKFEKMKIIAIDSNGKRGAAKEKLNQGFDVYLSAPIKQTDLYNSLIELSNPDIINADFLRGDNKKRMVDLPQFKARVLIVEDNIVNQKVAAGILKKFGLTIDVVGNGAEAITALSDLPYDLVFMDCQMPVMDGYEATATIRDLNSNVLDHNITVAAMTANVMKGDKERCLEAGMNDFVSKPISAGKLSAVLSNWLEHKKL